MKKLAIIALILSAVACESNITVPLPKNDWKERIVTNNGLQNLPGGTTYLSAYSKIYSINESKPLPLTVTVSIRNPNVSDTIFVEKADYYNTSGEQIRNYIKQPIYVTPMETVEIVISRIDMEGGSGANFIFDWKADSTAYDPIFEAVMIHAYGGNYGLSFSTQGVLLKKE